MHSEQEGATPTADTDRVPSTFHPKLYPKDGQIRRPEFPQYSESTMEQAVNISPEVLPAILHRFFNFEDGVVRTMTLIPRSIAGTVSFTIECMDRDVDASNLPGVHGQRPGWSLVEMVVRSVSEFRFEVGRRSFSVLSGGIQIAWRGEKIYVVLDAYPDDPGDLPDLKKNTAYVVGLSCEFTVTPLPVR